MSRPAPILAREGSYFRFRHLDGRVLVTNDIGRHVMLTEEEFEALAAGALLPEHPRYPELADKGFVGSELAADDESRILASRLSHLCTATNLHIMVVTLRCDHRCVYCHASRAPMGARGLDMSPEIAGQVLERVFESPAEQLTVEFQGGEPLANWRTVRFVVERARERAAAEGRELVLTLVSSLSLLDEDMASYLAENRVFVCTSLDGPADLHDANRPRSAGSAHAAVLRGIELMNGAYERCGYDPRRYKVDALLTVTRASLARADDIVDEYVERGLTTIHARPLNPFGFARHVGTRIAYPPERFLEFYRRLLDRILERVREGVDLRERTAAIHLTKILTDRDPNYMDLRSPCGAGIGQLAYDTDGSVFTCDEGRMVARGGDPIFRIGNVAEHGFRDLVGSPTVRALALASCLEALPGCAECAYSPFCGVCPVYNYVEQGDLVARQPTSGRCKLQLGLLDELFRRLDAADDETRAIFERWTWFRPLGDEGEG